MLANSSTATIPLYSYTACLRCITFAAKAAKPSAPLPTCRSSRWGKQTHTSQDMSRLKRIPKDNFWWKHCFMQERLFQLASWFFQRQRRFSSLASADFLWVSRCERPRPYAQTDAMVTYGFMDPVGVDSVGFPNGAMEKRHRNDQTAAVRIGFQCCIGGLPGWRDQSSIVEANWRLKWLTVFTCFRSSILSYGAVSLLFSYHCLCYNGGWRSCCYFLSQAPKLERAVKQRTCAMPWRSRCINYEELQVNYMHFPFDGSLGILSKDQPGVLEHRLSLSTDMSIRFPGS